MGATKSNERLRIADTSIRTRLWASLTPGSRPLPGHGHSATRSAGLRPGVLTDSMIAPGRRSALRQQCEDFFGDVVEEERDDTSLVTIMEIYHVAIQLKFPGQPIVNTLPRIFPEQDGPLPKFKFNWRDLGGGSLKTWLADPALEDATTLYLKEGAVEQTKPFTPGEEDTVTAQTWTGITMVGELDVLELRDGDGKTVARKNRDCGFGEPI